MSTDLEKTWIMSAELQGLLWTLKQNGQESDEELISQIKNVLSRINTMVDNLEPTTFQEQEVQLPDDNNDNLDEVPTNNTDIELEIIYDNEDNNPQDEINVADHSEFEHKENAQPDSDENNIDEFEGTDDAKKETVEDSTADYVSEEETCVEDSKPAINEETVPNKEVFEEQIVAEEPENNGTEQEKEHSTEQESIEPTMVQNQPCIISVDEKLSRKISSDIRKAFTLNDKFLYRRELFGNSAQQYNEAMELISEMHSYDEAEAYFFGNYGWDPDNNNVKNFMKILFNHFNS